MPICSSCLRYLFAVRFGFDVGLWRQERDRVLPHAHVFCLKRDSYRMKDRMKIGVVDPVEPHQKAALLNRC